MHKIASNELPVTPVRVCVLALASAVNAQVTMMQIFAELAPDQLPSVTGEMSEEITAIVEFMVQVYSEEEIAGELTMVEELYTDRVELCALLTAVRMQVLPLVARAQREDPADFSATIN